MGFVMGFLHGFGEGVFLKIAVKNHGKILVRISNFSQYTNWLNFVFRFFFFFMVNNDWKWFNHQMCPHINSSAGKLFFMKTK